MVGPTFLPELRARAAAVGYQITAGKPIPYGEQWIVSDNTTQIILNFWPGRGTIQLQGKASPLRNWLEQTLRKLRDGPPVAGSSTARSAETPDAAPTKRVGATGGAAELEIGMDESGKGDWYGPLVIAAVALDANLAAQLRQAGVRDSKLVERDALPELAARVRALVPEQQRSVLILAPEDYNQRYNRFQNINLLLADAYAELAAPLVHTLQIKRIICDQFSQRADRLNRAFLQRQLPQPLQMHHAEAQSVAVAAASILASQTFGTELDRLGRAAGLGYGLPAGASAIGDLQRAARSLIARHGAAGMAHYAKLNFKPVRAILGLPPLEPARG